MFIYICIYTKKGEIINRTPTQPDTPIYNRRNECLLLELHQPPDGYTNIGKRAYKYAIIEGNVRIRYILKNLVKIENHKHTHTKTIIACSETRTRQA